MTVNYEETPEFQKDFKRLRKRFRTLPEDLKRAKVNAIELLHIHKINNRSVFFIPNFCSKDVKTCKLKKVACRALKGRGAKSGIRIIYVFLQKSRRVVFIEIYFKGDKKREDYGRIKKYLKSLTSPTQPSSDF